MSDRDDHDDDWGSPTDWQRPPQEPAGPGPGGYAPPPPPSQPYAQPYAQPANPPPATWAPPPQSFLIPAILVTLFCFLPTGIAAIIFASQVSSKMGVGDVAGARQASSKAKTWVFVSVGVGVVVDIIVIAVSLSGSGSTY